MAEPEQHLSRICRVLIVEDDPAVQYVFNTVLTSEGFACVLARDAASMRSALAAGAVDVAIMDVVLPGGESGLALAKEVTERGCGIILVTGHHDRHAAVEASGYRHLFKPFRISALLALLDEVLKESKAGCEVKGRRYPK